MSSSSVEVPVASSSSSAAVNIPATPTGTIPPSANDNQQHHQQREKSDSDSDHRPAGEEECDPPRVGQRNPITARVGANMAGSNGGTEPANVLPTKPHEAVVVSTVPPSGAEVRLGQPEVVAAAVAADDEEEEEPSLFPWFYLPASKVYLPLAYQTVAFIFLFIFVMFWLCVVLTITTWRYPDPKTSEQLPDIALDILPNWPELEHVTDVFMYLLAIMCLGTVGGLALVARGIIQPADPKLLAKYPPLDTISQIPFIRFWTCYTAITFLRIIVVGATVLPATNNKCRPNRPDTGDFWWNAIVGVLTFGGSNVHCGDLLFSGHSSIITLAAAAAWEYGPIVSRLIRPAAVVFTLASWFTILASRSHYTDDIVVAFYVAVTLWLLTGHNGEYGAHAYWQLFIQSPLRVYRKVKEATAERDARRARRLAAAPVVVVATSA